MTHKTIFGRIPRPLKASLCTIGVVVLAVLLYISLGCPTFSMRGELRRAEKVNLVGPSKVVDIVTSQYREFEKMIVGETENGVCFLGKYRHTYIGAPLWDQSAYVFSYREKTGDITVLAAPNKGALLWQTAGNNLPVYIFADEPAATRAELELTVTGTDTRTVNGIKVVTNFSEVFTAEAKLLEKGVFRCILTSDNKESAFALAWLSAVSGMDPYGLHIDTVIPGIVRLYDKNGQLITEKSITISPYDQNGGIDHEN